MCIRAYVRVVSARASTEMDVLASFVLQVKGVMFYRYSVCGASMGDCVRLVRQPCNRHDANCIDVVLAHIRSAMWRQR